MFRPNTRPDRGCTPTACPGSSRPRIPPPATGCAPTASADRRVRRPRCRCERASFLRPCHVARYARQVPTGQASWIIPAITAAASLLGATVGAVATYWTSKKAHERESKRQERERAAETERRQSTLLREAAIRFVTTMTDISVAGDVLTKISHE